MQSGIWNQHLSAQTLHLRNGVSVRILVPWMHTPHTRTCRLSNLGMGMGSLCIHLELGAQGWALGPDLWRRQWQRPCGRCWRRCRRFGCWWGVVCIRKACTEPMANARSQPIQSLVWSDVTVHVRLAPFFLYEGECDTINPFILLVCIILPAHPI